MDMLSTIAASLFSALLAVALVLFTPIGQRITRKLWTGAPSFQVEQYELTENLLVRVFPANKTADRALPLGVNFSGVMIADLGQMDRNSASNRWIINLGDPRIPRNLVNLDQELKFELFFSPDELSNQLRVFIHEAALVDTPGAYQDMTQATVTNTHEFLKYFRSNHDVLVNAEEILLSSIAPQRAVGFKWIEVHDGFELAARGIENAKLSSSNHSRILVAPLYAWVLGIEDSRDISFSNLSFGHVVKGYCAGGVIRFQRVMRADLNGCELFGSGTYGFEVESSFGVRFVGTKIRDCSYGIGKIARSYRVEFVECVFENNGVFDLVEISSVADPVVFKKCKFIGNHTTSEDSVFFNVKAEIDPEHPLLTLSECEFEGNRVRLLTNRPDLIEVENCKFSNNVFQAWKA